MSPVSGERRIVIITGLSGAGKSNALQAFEDAGYFCIDNLPPRMIPAVMETTAQGNGGPDGVVVVVDIRGRRYFGEELERNLEAVEREEGWEHRILFIDSDDASLLRRYKESRRPHPAAQSGDVLEAIRRERRDLANVREMADLVVDTSGFSALDTRLRFKRLAESLSGRMTVSLLSFLIPRYAAEGKTYFTLGIGCTGGRHRSVAITEELAKRLRQEGTEIDLS